MDFYDWIMDKANPEAVNLGEANDFVTEATALWSQWTRDAIDDIEFERRAKILKKAWRKPKTQ